MFRLFFWKNETLIKIDIFWMRGKYFFYDLLILGEENVGAFQLKIVRLCSWKLFVALKARRKVNYSLNQLLSVGFKHFGFDLKIKWANFLPSFKYTCKRSREFAFEPLISKTIRFTRFKTFTRTPFQTSRLKFIQPNLKRNTNIFAL